MSEAKIVDKPSTDAITPPTNIKEQPKPVVYTFQPKVSIGVSCYINMDTRFAAQLGMLQSQPWYHGTVLDTAKPIDQARNNIVTKFLIDQPNATHLLWLDTDVIIQPGTIERLLSLNQPIVSGVVVQKMPPFYPLMNVRIAPDTYRFAIQWPRNEVIAVDAIGMGCVLTRRDVYQKTNPPWFSFAGKQSEDYYWCERCQAAGYQILADTSVQPGHIGDYVYSLSDFYKHQTDELDRSKAMGVTIKKGAT